MLSVTRVARGRGHLCPQVAYGVGGRVVGGPEGVGLTAHYTAPHRVIVDATADATTTRPSTKPTETTRQAVWGEPKRRRRDLAAVGWYRGWC